MNININNLKYLNTEMIMHLSACIRQNGNRTRTKKNGSKYW